MKGLIATLFILICIVILCICHTRAFLRIPESIDIVQWKSPQPQTYGNDPIILTGGIKGIPALAPYLGKTGATRLNTVNIPDISTPLKQLHSALAIEQHTTVQRLPKGWTQGISKRYTSCNIYHVESGTIHVHIYHPKHCATLARKGFIQEPTVYEEGLERWEASPTTKAQYVDIILRAGQTLIIPHIWLYDIKAVEASVVLHSHSMDWCTAPYLFLSRFRK